MFFTTIGTGLAWLMVFFGLLRVAMGFGLAFGDATSAVVSEFLGSATTGEAIDQGLYWAFIGVVLGVLAEISRSVARSA